MGRQPYIYICFTFIFPPAIKKSFVVYCLFAKDPYQIPIRNDNLRNTLIKIDLFNLKQNEKNNKHNIINQTKIKFFLNIIRIFYQLYNRIYFQIKKNLIYIIR